MGCLECGQDKKQDVIIADLSTPAHNKGCTDILWLVIFLFFWIGMIFITSFSITNGDGDRLLYGYDSFGNTCGKKNDRIANVSNSGRDMTKKRYVFFMNIENPAKSLSICVEKCPDVSMSKPSEYKKFAQINGVHLCSYDIVVSRYASNMTGNKGPCPVVVHKSVPILNRCVPYNLKNFSMSIITQIIHFFNDWNAFEKVTGDLYRSWNELVYLGLFSIVLSFMMILLMRFYTFCFISSLIVAVCISSLIGTGFLWWRYIDIRIKSDDRQKYSVPFMDIEIEEEVVFLIYSIVATILTLIILLLMYAIRTRIRLALGLFVEAGKCVMDIPFLLIQPFWSVFILAIFIIYWLITLAYISTAENLEASREGFVIYKDHKLVSYFWWYHIIGLVWTSEFILACEQLVMSEIVVTWYFSRKPNKCTVACAVCHVITYHMGTAAKGSFIITLIKIPRWIAIFLAKKLKNYDNKCVKFVVKSCCCYLWCLEKCMKYLNANAYTVTAIKGTDLCTSAKWAFRLVLNNILRVAAVNSIGEFLLFISKIYVMTITGAVAILYFKMMEEINYYAVPVLFVCVFAYIFSSCFMSHYEMVVNTLLLCFCEDMELNDGSEEKPYHMNPSFMEYMNDASKTLSHPRKNPDMAKEATIDSEKKNLRK